MNVAIKQELDADQWIDQFSKHEIVGYYRRRIQEVELSQKHIIKRFLAESEKGEQSDYKVLSELSTTIRDNTRALSEMGFAPPILAKTKEHIKNVININKDTERGRQNNDDYHPITEHIESGLYSPFDLEPTTASNMDSQRVF